MTTLEILDSLSDVLLSDERIFSRGEKELLAKLLHQVKAESSSRLGPTDTITRAVGELIAERAYGVLGERIAQRLVASSEIGAEPAVRAGSPGSPQPPSPFNPPPPSPRPPGPGGISRPMDEPVIRAGSPGSPQPPSPFNPPPPSPRLGRPDRAGSDRYPRHGAAQ
jgi:hypothetical protein